MGAMAKPFFRSCNAFVAKLLAIKEAMEFCCQIGFFGGKRVTDDKEAAKLLSKNS